MQALYSLPLHQQLIILLLVLSALFCVFCAVYGTLFRKISGTGQLPPLPVAFGSSFPNAGDKAYTIIFTAVYIGLTCAGFASGGLGAKGDHNIGYGEMLFTAAMYVPMIIRLAWVPKPTIPAGTKLFCLWALPSALLVILLMGGLMDFLGISQWISDMLNCPQNQDVVEVFVHGSTKSKIILAFSACIIATIGEECFFRGFLYNSLKGWAGPVAAALSSSFLFGCVHGALIQLPLLVFFALVQCYLYEKTRTLWVPMIFHALFNTFSLASVFFLYVYYA